MTSQDIHRLAVCSELRRNILINLNEGKRSLGDLRDEMQVSSTTILHALKELEKNNITFQDKDKNYSLTNIGRVVALKMLDFNDAAETLRKHEKFWIEHDLSGIPQHMIEKIGWLRNSDVMQINALDIIKTHISYVNFIKAAKWIRGVSPIYSSDYTTVFKELVDRNVEINLILSRAVLNKLINDLGLENFKNALVIYSLDILVSDEDLRVAFTVTDSYLSFGLFTKDGVYDTAYDLVSTDYKAVSWGYELFEYYRKKAKKYNP